MKHIFSVNDLCPTLGTYTLRIELLNYYEIHPCKHIQQVL